MISLTVSLHLNNLDIVCHIENSKMNTKQNKKFLVWFLKEEPFDKEDIAVNVHIMAIMPNEIVTKPTAISVSTTILKIAIKPATTPIKPRTVPILFFIKHTSFLLSR